MGFFSISLTYRIPLIARRAQKRALLMGALLRSLTLPALSIQRISYIFKLVSLLLAQTNRWSKHNFAFKKAKKHGLLFALDLRRSSLEKKDAFLCTICYKNLYAVMTMTILFLQDMCFHEDEVLFCG